MRHRELFFGEEVIPWGDPDPVPDSTDVFSGGFSTGDAASENLSLRAPVDENVVASDPAPIRPKWTLEDDK